MNPGFPGTEITMSKKKPAETNADNSTFEAASEVPPDRSSVSPSENCERAPADSTEVVAASAASLISEVQSFLERREELSRQLAEEIEATEKRLVELRRTASLLQAEAAVDSSKDRKPKKAKPKGTARPEKREPAPPADPASTPTPAEN